MEEQADVSHFCLLLRFDNRRDGLNGMAPVRVGH
jgi:hypothetical protein